MGRIALAVAIVLLLAVALYENNREKQVAEIQHLKEENQGLKGTPVIRSAAPQKEEPCEKTPVRAHRAAKHKKKPVMHATTVKKPMTPAAKAARKTGGDEIRRDYAVNLPADTALGDTYDPISSAYEDDILDGPLGILAFQTRPEFPGNEPDNSKPEHDGGGDGGHDTDRDHEHEHEHDIDRDRHGHEEAREHSEAHEHEEHGDDHHDGHAKRD